MNGHDGKIIRTTSRRVETIAEFSMGSVRSGDSDRSGRSDHISTRHPQESHRNKIQFVPLDRVGFPDSQSQAFGLTRAGVTSGYVNSSRSSRDSSNSDVSSTTAAMRMKRNSALLYKNTTGKDPDEAVIAKINELICTEPERKNLCDETKWMERLKLHLIRQGREKDAKRITELYQKLKGMSVVKNRENMIGLMYNLFDREATRTLLASARNIADQEEARNGHGRSEYREARSANQARQRKDILSVEVPNTVVGAAGTCLRKSPSTKDKMPSTTPEFDVDFAPVPSLHSTTDQLWSHEMSGDSKVPSLAPRKIEQDMNVAHRSRGANTWQSASSTSKATDDFNCNLNSGMESIASSNRYIQESTPMDQLNSDNRRRQFVNHRQAVETNAPLFRSRTTPTFHPASGGSIKTFTSTKSLERDLLRDMIFILQGINGTHIRTTPKGTYEIHTKQFVPPTLRLAALKLCELGHCYTKIKGYCEKSTSGLIAQGFKQAIENELQEYYRLLAVIQAKVQQSVVDTPLSEELPLNKVCDMTMSKLIVWLHDIRPRLQILTGMVHNCDSKHGGELCSVVGKYLQHCDPLAKDLTISLLSTVCKPLYITLSQWILYGELEDPYNEFFIAGDTTCSREHLWHLKYTIRPRMLPSFVSVKQAEKILAIGKNINFLKEVCNNADAFEGQNEIKGLLETGAVESLFWDERSPIQYAVEMAYKTTSEKVLKVLIDDSQLLDHLRAIKKYMLLGQGDFIQHFLELIQDELSKPASKLYTHTISAILESAVRTTNAQFENEDILSRLDTRILSTSDKDLGWDVFCLDYKAYGPIGTVLTEDVLRRYNKLFNSLWRTKRIEIILSTLWKNQTVLFKYLRLIPELAPVLHRSQLLISEMIHFVHQTQYYIMFEATECAWESLMTDVKKASDLDQVIKSHGKFLDTIFKRSLLNPESRDLLNQLRGVFDSVHELKSFLSEFNERVEQEVKCRKGLLPNTDEVREAQMMFFASYVKQAKGKIETLYTTTQDLVRTFLLVLNRQPDLNLQCLSFRLDFNEYYHQKDSRLSLPLTLQHRRLSSNAFTPINMSVTGLSTSQLLTSMSIREGGED